MSAKRAEVVACPTCNGKGRIDGEECRNCGGRTMSGRGTGKTYSRPDGTPCKHEYTRHNIGRCLDLYRCKHCPSQHEIDSGD